MVVLLILFLVLVIGGGTLLVRFAKSLEPGQRIVFVLAVILVLAYFVPRIAQRVVTGYRAAEEIDRQHGR